MAVVLRTRHIDWTMEWTLYPLMLVTLWETMYVTKAMPFAVSTQSGDNESLVTPPFLILNANTPGYDYTPDEAKNNESITKSPFTHGDKASDSGLLANGPEPRDPNAVNLKIADADSHNASHTISSDRNPPAENEATVSMTLSEYDNFTFYPHRHKVSNSSEATHHEPLDTVTDTQPKNTLSSEMPSTNSSSPQNFLMNIIISDQEVTWEPTTDTYDTSSRDVLKNDQNTRLESDISISSSRQSTPSWLDGVDYDNYDGEYNEDSISDDYDDGDDGDDDSPDDLDDDVIQHGGDMGINEHIFVSRPMSNHFGRSNIYPPHAVHGLIWEERHYIHSVLVPIACGIGGAILIVCVAYCLRNCNSDHSVSQPPQRKQRRPIIVRRVRPRLDHMLLMADTSDDELDRPR